MLCWVLHSRTYCEHQSAITLFRLREHSLEPHDGNGYTCHRATNCYAMYKAYIMLLYVSGSPYSHSPSGSIRQGYCPTGGDPHSSMCKTSGAYANGEMLPQEFSSRIPGTRNEQNNAELFGTRAAGIH